jgi:hypothetical protein
MTLWDDLNGDVGNLAGKGIQLADQLIPPTPGAFNTNPSTLAEWLIYIILLPITIPLNFCILAIRWCLVEAPLVVTQIKKMVGIGRSTEVGQIVAQCFPSGSLGGGIIGALLNPESEFDTGIMEAAVYSFANNCVEAAIQPLLDQISQCAYTVLMPKFVEPAVAASLYNKSMLDEGTAVGICRNYGFDADQSINFMHDAINPPDPITCLTLLNRGFIDSGTAYNWICQNGMLPEFVNPMLALKDYVPSVGEIRGYIQNFGYSEDLIGGYSLADEYPGAANTDLAKNGATEEDGIKAWVGHWTFPNVGDAANMMYRGLIQESTALDILKLNGVPNSFRSILLDSQQSIFTQRYIRNLYKYGIVNFDEVNESYLAMGFNSDRANKMAQLAVKMVNPISQDTLATLMRDAYEDGLVTQATAIQAYEAAGFSEYEAQLHLSVADYQSNSSILKEIESYVKAAYLAGDMTLDDAINYTLQYGQTPARAAILRETWQVNYDKTRAHLSEADSRTAYRLGIFNSSELRSVLTILRYSEDDISTIIAIENASLSSTQANTVAPITTATNKAHSFTKAELKDMLVDGVIDTDTWVTEMASLGYTDAQIADYLSLIVAKTGGSTSAGSTAS